MISKESRSQALSTLLDARMQHTRWVSEVLNNPNPQVEIDPSLCAFGRWLHSADEELQALPEFSALDRPHLELHQAYRLIRTTPDLEPRRIDIRQLSLRLIARIDALEQRLQKR